jgi:hypothetical protein
VRKEAWPAAVNQRLSLVELIEFSRCDKVASHDRCNGQTTGVIATI